MMILAVILAAASVLIDLAALILLRFPELKLGNEQDLPKVSILVPMFNEEANVHDLINSLLKLEYPARKLEILIGEDRSTDGTAVNLQQAAVQDARIKVVTITTDWPNLMGKANVIAQLIPHSSSDFFFITDADVRVPSLWLKTLLAGFDKHTGVIGGTTVVPVNGLWSGLQNLDWVIAQGLLSVAGESFGALAVSGTNMMVSREACEAIGGYEKIPYVLTEDIGLLTAVRQKGYRGRNVLHRDCTAKTVAQPDLRSLLVQRSRWSYGVLKLPLHIIILLLIRAMFLFFVAIVAVWQPVAALTLYLLKTLTDALMVQKINRTLRVSSSYWHLLFFELYWLVMAIGGLGMHLFAKKASWKGREYT